MTAPECPREQDVINAIVTGRWPHQCDEALHVHAADCQVCRELIAVTSVLCLERDGLHDDMSVPSAGQVWWRAAIRARLEASQQVVRPLSWLLGVAVACVVGLTIALIELLWSPAHKALGLATSWTTSFGLGEISRWLPTFEALTPLTTTGAFVLLGAAACLVLAPLALYFALSDE
jgi:hypothetical protein